MRCLWPAKPSLCAFPKFLAVLAPESSELRSVSAVEVGSFLMLVVVPSLSAQKADILIVGV